MRRLILLVLIVVTGCFSGRATLRPGSDMALPRSQGLADAILRGRLCAKGDLAGVGGVRSDTLLQCSRLLTDSTSKPPAKPEARP